MNILIIAQSFSPSHVIGAVRPSKLAKYLTQSGHKVTIITSENYSLGIDDILEKDQDNYGEIIKLPNSFIGNTSKLVREKVINLSNRAPTRLKVDKLSVAKNNKTFKSKIFDIRRETILSLKRLENQKWAKVCSDYVNQNFDIDQFDLVFTSYSSAANLLVGKHIKQAGFKCKWIADFRDPMILSDKLFVDKTKQIELQNDVIKKSDIITTVSEGLKFHIEHHMELNNLSVYKNKINVIYNGYDVTDYDYLISEKKNDNKYKIVYTGGLYNGRRDLTPLFTVLQTIKINYADIYNKIEFHYAGNDEDLIKFWAKEYQISSIVYNHGKISRKESLLLQAEANKVVILTWNGKEKYKQGVLPGKLYETMPLNCELLCLVQNESEKESELYNMVKKYNLGKTYNMRNDADNSIVINTILNDLIFDIKNMNQLLKIKNIHDFDYRNLARELLSISE